MLSTSIIFYLFVFTANIEKFPNTHLPAGEIFSSCFCSFLGLFLDATLELNSREGKRFLEAEICVTNFSCPTKTLLARFRKSAFGLSDKCLDLATSSSFKIYL